jgi:hypothetical protein
MVGRPGDGRAVSTASAPLDVLVMFDAVQFCRYLGELGGLPNAVRVSG